MAHVPREASWFSRHDVRTGVVVNPSRAAVRWFRGGVALTHDRIICNSLHFFLSRVCDRTVSRIKREGHLTLGIYYIRILRWHSLLSRTTTHTALSVPRDPGILIVIRSRILQSNNKAAPPAARFAKMREELAGFAGRGLGIIHPIRSTIVKVKFVRGAVRLR